MRSLSDPSGPEADAMPRRGRLYWTAWSVAAAFGAYFCMYAFRKPFTAAAYAEPTIGGLTLKTLLVASQVLGYAVSKFIGIGVIARMRPERRAFALLGIIAAAEISLVAFAVVPPPWNAVCLFFNGLPLGMVFGLVLGFLEGRRMTELLAAGLCASFILADGVTKSVGAWLLGRGVTEMWMPSAAGLLFFGPLVVCVWMLTRIPPPDAADVAARNARPPMTRGERRALVSKYFAGLAPIVVMYLAITILRSLRADFAPEIWRGLGTAAVPATFTYSEIWVAAGVLLVNGCTVLIRDNRRAFFTSLATCGLGAALVPPALWLQGRGEISAFTFMVVIGLGLYLPYVAVHTTVFERLLAMTRERGNLGFLMYLADAIGYLGYVAVMLVHGLAPKSDDFMRFFGPACWVASAVCMLCVVAGVRYFLGRQSESALATAEANG